MKFTTTKQKAGGKAAPGAIIQDSSSSNSEGRLDQIAIAAYYKAEARGFSPDQELDDWLKAETEFDQRRRN